MPSGAEPPPHAARFFNAEGRDVAVPETRLEYDKATRRLTLAGGSRGQHASTKHEPTVLAAVETNPGATGRALEAAWGAYDRNAKRAALKALIRVGKVHTYPGPSKRVYHVLSDDCGSPTTCELAH